MENSIPDLYLASEQKLKYHERRNSEENALFDRITQQWKGQKRNAQAPHALVTEATDRTRGMTQTSVAEQKAQNKRAKRSKKLRDPNRPAKKKALAWDGYDEDVMLAARQYKQAFTTLPIFVKHYTTDSLLADMKGTNVVLVMNFRRPDDAGEMLTFQQVTGAAKQMVDAKLLTIGVIEDVTRESGFEAILGRPPSLTIFRGLGTPHSARFEIGRYVPFGQGGSLRNATHVTEFITRQTASVGRRSLEIGTHSYDDATQASGLTVAVFFYAPWCDECRPIAESYDEIAQILGDRDYVILTRVDISRHNVQYRKLGSPPLPAVFVYDRSAKDAAVKAAGGEAAPSVRPRQLNVRYPGRETLRHFIMQEDAAERAAQEKRAAEEAKAREELAALDALIDRDLQERDPAAAALVEARRRAAERNNASASDEPIHAPAHEAAEISDVQYAPILVPDYERLIMSLREWERGVLVMLTATWCAHCGRFQAMYQQAIGPMRTRVYATLLDVTDDKSAMRDLGIKSLPAVLYLRAPASDAADTSRPEVIRFSGQKTAAAFAQFGLANVRGLAEIETAERQAYPVIAPRTPGSGASGRVGPGGVMIADDPASIDQQLLLRARTRADLVKRLSTGDQYRGAHDLFAKELPAARAMLSLFVAPTCGVACRRASEVVSITAAALEGDVRVIVVNATSTTEQRQLQREYDVRSYPQMQLRCANGLTARLSATAILPAASTPGWRRRAGERLAVAYEDTCMRGAGLSEEELRELSAGVRGAVLPERTLESLLDARKEMSTVAFLRSASDCPKTPECARVAKAVEGAAAKIAAAGGVAVRFAAVDTARDRTLRLAMRRTGIDAPYVAYLHSLSEPAPINVTNADDVAEFLVREAGTEWEDVSNPSIDSLVQFTRLNARLDL
jgi:thiol-disulfide isomerase/thioredoxin